MEKKSTFLLSARCEDGENMHIETEWDLESPELGRIIAPYVLLGARIAHDLTDGKHTQAVFEEYEKMFRQLQDVQEYEKLIVLITEEDKA